MKDVGFCKHLLVARHCARCCVGCGWGERHKIKKEIPERIVPTLRQPTG